MTSAEKKELRQKLRVALVAESIHGSLRQGFSVVVTDDLVRTVRTRANAERIAEIVREALDTYEEPSGLLDGI